MQALRMDASLRGTGLVPRIQLVSLDYLASLRPSVRKTYQSGQCLNSQLGIQSSRLKSQAILGSYFKWDFSTERKQS